MKTRPVIFLGALLLAACPLRNPDPPKDDSSEPADEGETGEKSKPADEESKAKAEKPAAADDKSGDSTAN